MTIVTAVLRSETMHYMITFINALHAVGTVKMRVELQPSFTPVPSDSSRNILIGMATSYGPDGQRLESQ